MSFEPESKKKERKRVMRNEDKMNEMRNKNENKITK